MTTQSSQFFRHLLRALFALLLSAPIIILLLSVQTGPAVLVNQAISPDELSQIERMLLEKAPRSPAEEGEQLIRLDEDELNLLLRYAMGLMKVSPQWAAKLKLAPEEVQTELSIDLLRPPIPLYLNISGIFTSGENLLELSSLQIGKLRVPTLFLNYTVNQLRNTVRSGSSTFDDLSDLLANVNSVDISAQSMNVNLHWNQDLFARIGSQAQQLFISEQDQLRIMSYYQQIGEIAATIPADIRAVSLNSFLVPLFVTAAEKSAAGSDAIAENRTLFQTLAIYVNQESIDQLLGPELTSQLPPAKIIEVRLRRRQDLAQHLVSIAAITASAGADLAELLSITKEAYDARYRSGFSFSDLTANSVGVAMASLSTNGVEQARQMQLRMTQIQSESDYMPEVSGNEDGISESDFNKQFQDRNSLEYQEKILEIQDLIANSPLFSGLDI